MNESAKQTDLGLYQFKTHLLKKGPEKLCNIYLCKIISRQRGNFNFLGPENQSFWLLFNQLLTDVRTEKLCIVMCIYCM